MMRAQLTSHIQPVTRVPSSSSFLEETGTECVQIITKRKSTWEWKRQKRNKEDTFQSQKTSHITHVVICSIHASKPKEHMWQWLLCDLFSVLSISMCFFCPLPLIHTSKDLFLHFKPTWSIYQPPSFTFNVLHSWSLHAFKSDISFQNHTGLKSILGKV